MEPVYRLAEELGRLPVRKNMRWHVEGVERIPSTGPVLLASNHISYFDPVAIGYLALKAGRRVRFLAKAELFEGRLMGACLRRMGQIPIERGRGDAAALDRAAAALRAGECVHVFPEGTISDEFEPMAGKTGLARLARSAGVEVLPVGLWGTHRVIPPGDQKPERWRTPITIVVGEPIRVGPTPTPGRRRIASWPGSVAQWPRPAACIRRPTDTTPGGSGAPRRPGCAAAGAGWPRRSSTPSTRTRGTGVPP